MSAKRTSRGPRRNKNRPVDPTDSPAFRRWFGKSFVREPTLSSRDRFEDQKPIVVYHGTNSLFNAFKAVRRGTVTLMPFGEQVEVDRHGIFFAENQAFARTFGKEIVPVYLSIQNPMWLTEGFGGEEWDKLAAAGLSDEDLDTVHRLGVRSLWEAFDGDLGARFVAVAKAAGYDGAVLQEEGVGLDDYAPLQTVWVAFDPRQVKSATRNVGTFDPDDPDLTHNTRLDESREEAAERLRAANRRCAAALRRIDTKLGAGQKELWDALAEAGSAGEFKRLLAEHKARMDKITPQNAARRERIMLEWEDAISEAIDLRVACAPPMRQNGKRELPPEISAAMPSIIKVAQQTYDDWHQDEEGLDEELGEGGICHLIAEEICSILASHGLDCGSVSAQVGEQHVWAVVKIDGVRDEDGEYDRDNAGVWSIDIPPGVYESGGGYSWRKKPGVAFEAADVVVTHESRDPDDFERFME